ncbi:MAG: DUF4282 domain-containing protein [Phycisphaerales bacterium]|nr:MAG: DUF4282 domain-containing protein [Phycisphaerales bacterium]
MPEYMPASTNPSKRSGPPVLLDFSFTRFITLRVIKILYVLGLVLVALAWVVFVIRAFNEDVFAGIAAIGIGIFVALLYIILFRVWLELIVVIFRIAENTTKLVEIMKNAPR